ncbi:MAG: DeoR/GlpR family DNA-binding transcription regulator [Chloroflexota bacterium]|nr:DeoR/GlpR family DNA-binding transcription regulator [Chloroflexota bacterium]
MSYERKKRLRNIVYLFKQEEELSVKEISGMLHVSDMTIRRDLDALEQQGVVRRNHGGAVLLGQNTSVRDPYILGEQTAKNAREKNLIGIKAASLVQPHETIFLDSGSTTPFIAKNLNSDLPITVICYTFTNALEFYPRKNANLILLGGYFHRDSNVFHSPENHALIRNTRADKAFISTGGLDPELGLTTYFNYEAAIKREMIRSAKHIILVADSTKFGSISVTHFAELSDIDTIITDDGLTKEYRNILVDRGIELHISDQEDTQ